MENDFKSEKIQARKSKKRSRNDATVQQEKHDGGSSSSTPAPPPPPPIPNSQDQLEKTLDEPPMATVRPTMPINKYKQKQVRDQMQKQASHVGKLHHLQRLLIMVEKKDL